MPPIHVVVTGTISFDYIMDFSGRFGDRIMADKIHSLSLSFLVDRLHKQFGGTAGNIAYTLNILGVVPWVLAPAGRKDFELYERHLKKHKISTKYISLHNHVSTSSYFVMTDSDDNQIGSFYLGATKFAKNLTISKVPKQSFVVLSATEPSAMNTYVLECAQKNFPYMYDPAFQVANFSADELKRGIEHAKILIGNDYEIALIEEKIGISHEELILLVPVLVTTLGAKGSIIETRHDAMHIKPATPKNISDPTGAGDAYRAGFVAGYLRGYDLPVCGQMGSVAAVYTVEKYGTQTHDFTKKEFIARYKENFGTTIKL
ncbi:MAG TPA: carbohydrate kinase family protein [Patescibacteria group bacterium]|nr:carbohydrate kinase family protein [Patescibacteria group bacterium]